MEISSSVSKLCFHLISSAFQRCRLSEDICRLSVILKSSPASDAPIIRISISDTGTGCSLEEFQNLRYIREDIAVEKWDGLLSVTTTSFCDNEVHRYLLNLRETISGRRMTRLPSNPKNGVKFRHFGTEICLSVSESIDVLIADINDFFRKILILKIPNVAIELVVGCEDIPGSQCENIFLANDTNPLPFSTSSIERLKSGLEDYILKHGHRSTQNCKSCFSTWDNLKVGSGTACTLESHKSSRSGLMVEVVIILSELDPTCPLFKECFSTTEVLYFEDYKPCPISESILNALTSIDWKIYGLAGGNIVDREGDLLGWENLPPHTRLTMVLHSYHKQIPPARPRTQTDRCLIKRAIKHAMDDLKEKHAGILLSANALKIRSYAPDLARSIAGLILSSNDSDFQEECFTLLGLQSTEIGGETVEESIKEKIISVIDMNDRKSQTSKEVEMAPAPLLFEDDRCWNSNFQDEEYEGENEFSLLD